MAPPSEYPLARTHISSARLNLQHYNWKQANGFHLHPDIVFDTNRPRIADIGTGTGIWLLDLNESLGRPGAQLDGFDIDLSQTPPREWLPPNVSMRRLDIFDDLPDDLIGNYDVVHVRFFICVVQNGEPAPIVSKLTRMLKPGGYLQWTEMDFSTLHIESISHPDSLPATQALFQLALSPSPKWPASQQEWVKDLGLIFRNAQLDKVKETRRARKPWQHPFYHDITLIAMEEMSAKAPDPASVRDLVARAAYEFEVNRRAIDIAGTSVTVLGRKERVA